MSQPKSRVDLWIRRCVVNTLYQRKIVSSFSFHPKFFSSFSFCYFSSLLVLLGFILLCLCLHLFYRWHFSAEIILWYARGVTLYSMHFLARTSLHVTYDFSPNTNQIKLLCDELEKQRSKTTSRASTTDWRCVPVFECDKQLP